jgi:hypothetical protein
MVPIKSAGDRESAAFAICQSSVSACYHTDEDDVDIFLAATKDGVGPVLAGVAALNDPHIPGLQPLEVAFRGTKEMIKAHILRLGVFRHPNAKGGKLIVNQSLYNKLKENFASMAFGRKIILDDAHEPNKDSLGEIVELEQQGDLLFAWVEPTTIGLSKVKDKLKNYASAWLQMNWKGVEVQMSSTEFEEEDILEIALQQAEKELEIMAQEVEGATPPEVTTPPEVPAPEGETITLTLAEHEALVASGQAATDLEKEHQVELAAISTKTDTVLNELQEELRLAREQRETREEELRLERIDLHVEKWSTPGKDGGMLPKQVIELTRSVLRGEAFGEDDAKIELAADADASVVHTYYRQAIDKIVNLIPRVVPAGQYIMPMDRRPATSNGRSEEVVALRRQNLIDSGMASGRSEKEAEERADEILAKGDVAMEVPHA